MLQKIKDKAIEIVLTLVITSVILWAGNYLRLIYGEVKAVPDIRNQLGRLDEVIDDLQKDNTRIKQKMHDDSIRRALYEKLKHKP
jgi:hypothetical protein